MTHILIQVARVVTRTWRGRVAVVFLLVPAMIGVGLGEASAAATTSFAGSCQLSGSVRFQPPLTTSPQTGRVYATAEGTCTGTLTGPSGRPQSVNGEAVEAVAQSAGTESCETGSGKGFGSLDIGGRQLSFTYTELRAGPVLALMARGDGGGSATAEGNVSPSVNPLSILQACASTGLTQAPIDLRLITTPAISG